MTHVVHTFDQPLQVVVDKDGVVVSSPKGCDMVLSPKSARATGERLIHGSEEALSAPAKTGDEPPAAGGAQPPRPAFSSRRSKGHP